MNKRLLLCFFGIAGFSIAVYSCHNIAVEMSYGEMLYRSKCSSCHNVIEPSRFDKEKWLLYVDKYGQKIKAEEKREIIRYLVGSD